ncbi:EF-hand calcium-binding domain-containing protein 6 [Sturnira hondurensis]|uniref:EF-hand calcium-binding domain-containing protein 6 n=1 Tax=Sturnira hondurensis TaxID=192404 RepID=UPI00187A0D34|nr:EF-hand calcium-binding domain-containing protein 6 [Sturnira hondurensis]
MNQSKMNVSSIKSGSTKARDLMRKMAIMPDWHTSCPHTQKFTDLRPHSSPCRLCSRNGFPNMVRPSSTTAIANPILSFLDVKRILFQKITAKGDALVKAFHLLDTSHTMTVSKSGLRRIVTTFLLPLTREQFREVLAQIPLTSSGAVPYCEFLSRFGGIDPQIHIVKRDSGHAMRSCRTLKELEIQLGEKILRNIKTVVSALELIDVHKTGLVRPQGLRRVLETFCLRMTDEEYKVFAQHYDIDKDAVVDYNVFLKNLSINNNLNLKYHMGNQEVSRENQQVRNSRRDYLSSSDLSASVWEDRPLDEIGKTFCQEFSKSREKIEKALSAGDPSQCGYVSLNYLKIVLDTFVHRLPRRTFIQLLKRFGLKTTKKINWKQFLASLHDPQWTEVSDTGPLTRKPCTDSKSQFRKENVITKLFGHGNHYTSLKKALLVINSKADGQMKGEELRHVLNCVVRKLSDSEFGELMQMLDPQGTGLVAVRTLTQLLQEAPPVSFVTASESAFLCGPGNLAFLGQSEVPTAVTCGTTAELAFGGCSRGLLPLHLLPHQPGGNSYSGCVRSFRALTWGSEGRLACSRSQSRWLTRGSADGHVGRPQSSYCLYEPLGSPYSLFRNQTGKLPSCTDAGTLHRPAPDSLEAMVCDAIGRNAQAFHSMLRSYDLGDTGLVGAGSFKKVMHIFCPCLTTEHLTKLCSQFQDTASGRVLYKTLLASMGVNGPPPISPVLTPKDRLFRERVRKEEQQQPECSERTKPTEERRPATENGTKEEAVRNRQPCAQQQDPAFGKQLLDFSEEPGGKVNVRDVRKAPEDQGMLVGDDQYAHPTARKGFKKERSDLDFATRVGGTEGPQVNPPQTAVPPKSTVTSHFVTAEECLQLLPQRLKEFFRNPYAAFFRMDADRDGIVSMQDLHRLLRRLMFNLRDEEFERLLGLLGLKLSVTLNFREFRNLFEKEPCTTDNAPQRLIRAKQKVTDSELACEQAHQYLVTKAKTRWSDLSKNFLETDSEGTGILRRRDVRNVLFGFDIPLTPREFEKLWMRYDTEGRGQLTHQEFLQKLGIDHSADVHRPYAEDYFNFMGHFTKPQQGPAKVLELPQSAGKAASARDKLRDRYEDVRRALTTLGDSKGSPVSVCQLQKALREGGCPLEEEELTELLGSWGISCQNNGINHLDFLRAVENSKPPSPESKEKEAGVPISFERLRPEEVLKSVQKVVAASAPALSAAFSALDKEDTGFVKPSDFGQVLRDFCYKLTETQYHYFLRKLRLHLTPYINWKYFLQNFTCFLEETASEWAEKMPRGPLPRSPKETVSPETLARLHKAVIAHYHAIAQDFENFDTLKASTVSRDEFRAICTRHVQILTDEQFDQLWGEMPVDAKGRLKYPDFLSRFSSEKAATPPSTDDSAKAQRGSEVPEVSGGGGSAGSPPTQDLRTGTKARSHLCMPPSAAPGAPLLQNCEPIERELRRKVRGCWRELLKECKERDVHRRGAIAAAEFPALVEKFRLDVSKEECQQLIRKYDLKGDGNFAYCDFLQSCVLLLKTKETSLMRRMKIQNAHKMKEAGAETSSFYSALLRIQPKILHCWRPMRRTFKAYDAGSTGLVGVADFRKVLREYSINLSEEEFFHILEYYDKTLSSKISYNDFLRAFLQ